MNRLQQFVYQSLTTMEQKVHIMFFYSSETHSSFPNLELHQRLRRPSENFIRVEDVRFVAGNEGELEALHHAHEVEVHLTAGQRLPQTLPTT